MSSLALVAVLGIGYTTMVEAQPQREMSAVDMRDNRDNFDMGWLGLIGLVGLFGMKRSDARDRAVTRTDSGLSSTAR
jgi:hypothetical protein